MSNLGLLVLAASVFCGYCYDDLNIAVDETCNYVLSVGADMWLRSAPTIFHNMGSYYSTDNGALALKNKTYDSGKDELGLWESVSCHYIYHLGTRVHITFRNYHNIPFTVLEQVFDDHVQNASVGDVDKLASSFPNFYIKKSSVDLGYLNYGGIMVGNTGLKFGSWDMSNFKIESGRNSGPIAIFDKMGRTLFMSPFNNFMAASGVHDILANTYGWGVMGGVEEIPRGFTLATGIYYSDEGIGKAIEGWGNIMRKYYRKPTFYRESDITLNYLSYWSDNGAYYINYYLPPPYLIQNATYETGMVNEIEYARKEGIPYKSIQYSVWFKQGKGNGVSLWEPNLKLFPHGMKYMFNKTLLPATAHNRWWTPDTPYAKQNGGKYDWIIEDAFSLPIDQKFWDDFFVASRQMGFTTLMQDWLNNQFGAMHATTKTVDIARLWLQQMGEGARKAGLTIQYCMSMSRHVLQSLEIPVVNQARASDDYRPGSEAQYQIGISSMFAHAVGIAPFKDTFWTTTKQPGPYYKTSEPYPALHAVVSTLSTGPVGPGDMVGATNKTLLMKCCRDDGLILKPSRPAFAIDAQIIYSAFGGNSKVTVVEGEVWTTYTDIGGMRFGIIFAAMLKSGLNLYPSQTGIFNEENNNLMVYSDNGEVNPFNEDSPLKLGKQCSVFCLYYTTVVSSVKLYGNDTVILGELNKWVPMSPQRVLRITQTENDILVHVTVAPKEIVHFQYRNGNRLIDVICQDVGYEHMYISLGGSGCFPEIGHDYSPPS